MPMYTCILKFWLQVHIAQFLYLQVQKSDYVYLHLQVHIAFTFEIWNFEIWNFEIWNFEIRRLKCVYLKINQSTTAIQEGNTQKNYIFSLSEIYDRNLKSNYCPVRNKP